ncbi:hypothetical protein PoB_002818200 [Plakobranchus ocellatus]|uniref:Uncharacterized protein n=1 Tax=Plakobranchus ocellatus TaxID=259542 RepID=A0AAV4A496_9GAST|nr:hypothetical protein PoB_002818200 [Plakobranchus ocellatus]
MPAFIRSKGKVVGENKDNDNDNDDDEEKDDDVDDDDDDDDDDDGEDYNNDDDVVDDDDDDDNDDGNDDNDVDDDDAVMMTINDVNAVELYSRFSLQAIAEQPLPLLHQRSAQSRKNLCWKGETN